MMGRMRTMVAAAVVMASVGMHAVPARASDYALESGMGVAAVAVDVLYIPAKFVYATLGGVTGGFAYLLTGADFDAASTIWKPSMGGTYVVTPNMVAGNEPIHFSGTQADDTVVADSRVAHEDEQPRSHHVDADTERPTKPHAHGEAY
jgi:hypothetical protein